MLIVGLLWSVDSSYHTIELLLHTLHLWLMLTGSVLFASGIARPVAISPRCANCRYSVLGLPALTCPECNADLSAPLAIKDRTRRTHWPRVGLGGLSLLLSFAVGRAGIAATNSGEVLAAWVAGSPVVRGRDVELALEELHRAAVGPAAFDTIIDRSLTRLERDRLGEYHIMCIALLLKDGKLRSDQTERYIRVVASAELASDRNGTAHLRLEINRRTRPLSRLYGVLVDTNGASGPRLVNTVGWPGDPESLELPHDIDSQGTRVFAFVSSGYDLNEGDMRFKLRSKPPHITIAGRRLYGARVPIDRRD